MPASNLLLAAVSGGILLRGSNLYLMHPQYAYSEPGTLLRAWGHTQLQTKSNLLLLLI